MRDARSVAETLSNPMHNTERNPNPSKSQGQSARSSSGAVVRLRSLGLVCVAQTLTALAMWLCGTIAFETMTSAIYFPWFSLAGAWLFQEKPNDFDQPTPAEHRKPQ